jgi:hypothetical protein
MPTNSVSPTWRKNSINFGLILAALFLIVGCFWSSERNSMAPQTGDRPPVEQKSDLRSNTVAPTPEAGPNRYEKSERPDNGDFIVQHGTIENQRYAEIDKQIKDGRTLEQAAEQLNENLKLPTDIYLKTKDCGEINAQYDPNNHTITVCYELMMHFYKIFKNTEKTDQDAYNKMFEAVRFAFLHELGHAMIDVYNLPIAGNEEDAADRVSAYICLDEIKDGVKSVLAAADAFAYESKGQKPVKQDMADEHLLEQQRFYNSLCMIYGSNTVKYSNLKDHGYLPAERAERCPSEYERTMQSWKELLKPWRKN